MANACGAWDNAKKILVTELHANGTELRKVSVGDAAGDTLHRAHSLELPYRMVKDSFCLGICAKLFDRLMPAHAARRRDHIMWWRSANL